MAKVYTEIKKFKIECIEKECSYSDVEITFDDPPNTEISIKCNNCGNEQELRE